jgi:hypothetical protein
MELKGTIHKISSVFLRFGELVCGLVVLGIFGRFCYIIHGANVSVDGRIIYSMVTAAIGIIFSLAVCPPFNILFLGFPFDFVMFIMWLVAFCLLETVCLSYQNTSWAGRKLQQLTDARLIENWH